MGVFHNIAERVYHWVFAYEGEPVDKPYAECGDVRFAAPNPDGGLYPYVLLYAIGRVDGLYEIGAVHENRFNRGDSVITLWAALLDHVPDNGEFVDEWVPFADESDLRPVYARAARYLRDNGFKGSYIRAPYPDFSWLRQEAAPGGQ